MNCRRKHDENLRTFVSRFCGLAAKHLIHARASPSSQTGQVLEITLLNNVNLDEGTLNNAKSDLIKYAKNREEGITEAVQQPRSIPMTTLTPILVASQ